MTLTPTMVVCAAIRHEDGRYLHTQRPSNGRWEIPGGKVDPGEADLTALVREIKEETGVIIQRFQWLLTIHDCICEGKPDLFTLKMAYVDKYDGVPMPQPPETPVVEWRALDDPDVVAHGNTAHRTLIERLKMHERYLERRKS